MKKATEETNADLTTTPNLPAIETTNPKDPSKLEEVKQGNAVLYEEPKAKKPEVKAVPHSDAKLTEVPQVLQDEKLCFVDMNMYEKAKTPDHPDPECHLLFVIHGIGATPKKLSDRIIQLGQMLPKIRKQKEDRHKTPVHIKILDWKSSLNSNVKDSIEKATLRSNPLERKMLNQIPTDLLFYLTPEHARVIISEVVMQANQCYERFKEAFPSVKVSIIGHSLGSVILYDVISQNYERKLLENESREKYKLNFSCEQVFLIGSPLSIFQSINGQKVKLLDQEKLCKGFYNIFHPNDLLAYRVEPLMEAFSSHDEAMPVPYIVNDGSKRKADKENRSSKMFLAFCTMRDKGGDDKGPKEDLFAVNAEKELRYDYVLQESLMEYMFETLGILGGHWGYWENPDLFYFLLNKLELTPSQQIQPKPQSKPKSLSEAVPA